MKESPAVIDTNVLVSGLITGTSVSPTARILDGMINGRFRFLLSLELIAEYREVLLRPKIQRQHDLSEIEVDALLTEIVANGALVEVEESGRGGRKADDHLRNLLLSQPSGLSCDRRPEADRSARSNV